MTPYAAPTESRLSTAALIPIVQRSERHGEQEQREQHHGTDEPRHPLGDLLGEVHVPRGGPDDVVGLAWAGEYVARGSG